IEIIDSFSEPLARWRDDLKLSRAAWNEFRADIRAISADTANVGKLAQDMRDVSKAQKETARTAKGAKKELTVQEEAAQSLAREMRNLAVENEKEARAQAKGIVTRKGSIRISK